MALRDNPYQAPQTSRLRNSASTKSGKTEDPLPRNLAITGVLLGFLPPFSYGAYIVCYAAVGGAVSHMAGIVVLFLVFLAPALAGTLGLIDYLVGRDVVKNGRW